MTIGDNNKVPTRPRTKSGPSLGKRPTPIQRRLKIKLRAYSTVSAAKSDESFGEEDVLSDSEDEGLANSKQLVDISAVMEKYFNNNDQLSYVMEKMVSDLSTKVVDERQKNANRAREEVFLVSANETLPGTLWNKYLRNKYHSPSRIIFWILVLDWKQESKRIIRRVEQEISALSLQLNQMLSKTAQENGTGASRDGISKH